MNAASPIRRAIHTAPRAAVILTIFALAGALLAPTASAAESYSLPKSWTCNSGWAGGNLDADGTMYVSCGGNIIAYTRAGAMTTYKVSRTYINDSRVDVAPSPHGEYLYVAGQANVDGMWIFTLRRWTRSGDRYIEDTQWRPEGIPYGGKRYTPQGRYVTTDALGNIYFSNGLYVGDVPTVVTKYAPDGKWITNVGDIAPGGVYDASTYTEGLFWRFTVGVAANRDGSRLYVAESGNSRIQRFDLQADGTYRYARMWGDTQADNPVVCTNGVCERQGSCAPEKFGVPYDITTDAWGFVYAMNTACERVHKYTPDGDYLGNWYLDGAASDGLHNRISHTVAVDGHGNIYVGEANRKFDRTSAEPGMFPGPPSVPVFDTTAPVLSAVTVPNPTNTRTFTVQLAATDNVGVTQMRVTNDSDGQGHYLDVDEQPWQAYRASFSHTIHDIRDTQGVIVQVRDAAGNESNVKVGVTRYIAPVAPEPPADAIAPVLSAVTVPNPTNALTFTVQLAASDNVGVTQMRVTNDSDGQGHYLDVDAQPWQTYKASFAHTIHDIRDTQGVVVQVRDAAGNVSNVKVGVTRYVAPVGGGDPQPEPPIGGGDDPEPPAGGNDAIAPVLSAVTVPNPTNALTFTVKLTATDNVGVTQMRVTNDSDGQGHYLDVDAQPWQTYKASFSHTIHDIRDTQGVVVQVRDAAGNESNVKVGVTRYVAPPVAGDAVAPTVDSIAIPDDNPATAAVDSAWRQVIVTLTGSDNVAVTQMRVANEDADVTEQPWRDYATTFAHTLSPNQDTKAISVQLRDAAGNISTAKRLIIRCVPCADKQAGRIARRMGSNKRNAIRGTMRTNIIIALAGNDTINASQNDHRIDIIFCGKGRDTARIRPGDITIACERVIRIRTTKHHRRHR